MRNTRGASTKNSRHSGQKRSASRIQPDSRPGFPGLLSAGMTSAGLAFFRGNDERRHTLGGDQIGDPITFSQRRNTNPRLLLVLSLPTLFSPAKGFRRFRILAKLDSTNTILPHPNRLRLNRSSHTFCFNHQELGRDWVWRTWRGSLVREIRRWPKQPLRSKRLKGRSCRAGSIRSPVIGGPGDENTPGPIIRGGSFGFLWNEVGNGREV